MKVTVELDSTYFEGNNLDEEIANKIKQKVVNKIWGNLKKEVESEIQSVVQERVRQQVSDRIQEEASVLAKTAKIRPTSYKYKGEKDELTIEEYVKYQFSENGKVDIEDILKKRAKNIAEKLKDKYDLVFAQQIIMKMKEQDLLKEDVEQALFDTKMKDTE